MTIRRFVVDGAVVVLVGPQVAVVVGVGPVVREQAPQLIDRVVVLGVHFGVRVVGPNHHQVGVGVPLDQAGQVDEIARRIEVVRRLLRLVRRGEVERLDRDPLEHAVRHVVRAAAVEVELLRGAAAGRDQLRERLELVAAVVARTPLIRRHPRAQRRPGGEPHRASGVERARALREGVVPEVGRPRLQEAAGPRIEAVGNRRVGGPERLVDERGRASGDRGRAAGAAPGLPCVLAARDALFERARQVHRPGRVRPVCHQVDAGSAGRGRSAVGPVRDVVVVDLAVPTIESHPVAPNCVEAPTLMPVTGDGPVTVPKPGAPLPLEKIWVVVPPNRSSRCRPLGLAHRARRCRARCCRTSST